MTYYVFQVVGRNSYTSVIESDRTKFLEKLGEYVTFMNPGAHIKVGEVKARSIHDALHKMERNEMDYEEMNKPLCTA